MGLPANESNATTVKTIATIIGFRTDRLQPNFIANFRLQIFTLICVSIRPRLEAKCNRPLNRILVMVKAEIRYFILHCPPYLIRSAPTTKHPTSPSLKIILFWLF